MNKHLARKVSRFLFNCFCFLLQISPKVSVIFRLFLGHWLHFAREVSAWEVSAWEVSAWEVICYALRLLVATVNWHKSLQFAKKSNITLLPCLFMILLAVSLITIIMHYHILARFKLQFIYLL